MLVNADESSFSIALKRELMSSMSNAYGVDNWDHEIRGEPQSTFAHTMFVHWQMERLSAIPSPMQRFSYLYDRLSDEPSRSTLVKVVAYRLLGYTKVKLPVNTEEYWSARESVRSLIKGTESVHIKFNHWTLNRFQLADIGYSIELFHLPVGVVTIFILKQYEYRKRIPALKAQDGDYVIDGGGCWGDTALEFANSVGPRGKVYSFEFVPDNLEVFHRNMDLNPQLADRVALVEKGLWDKSGEDLTYCAYGPASSLDGVGGKSLHASTVSIDDLVAEENLPRVDFIKMDVERAELRALRGAEKTIRAFRPKLAISLYHKESDFGDVPYYLESLGVGYDYFLDHFTIFEDETVLFAAPRVR